MGILFNLEIIKNRKANILDQQNYHQSAVIVPLVNENNVDYLLFEVRSANLIVQPGEICFPGGGIESEDKNPQEAAIRETCEELGIKKENIDLIGPLDILVTPFESIISPFVARIHRYQDIRINTEEVESFFLVPVQFFLENPPQTFYNNIVIKPSPDFPYYLLPNGKTYNWRAGTYPVHFYIYKDKIIWGITARIVNHFIKLISGSPNE